MQVRPLVATPCYGGMVCLNYMTSIIRLRTACSQIGMELEFCFKVDSMITRARNDCVAHFLAGDWTHLFFIDADIGFEPKAALRLLHAGHDVVAGVYRLKDDGAHFAINPTDVGPAFSDGFAPALEAPTGFMCIARDVFHRIAGANPHLQYEVPGKPAQYRFFDAMIDPDTHWYLSEDYAFCRLWKQVSGEVYVDTRSDLTHQGTKLYAGAWL